MENLINHRLEKLERPDRLAELAPEATLARIGFARGDSVCDIGAGSGIFTLPAARGTSGPVYAVDPNEGLLQVLETRASAEGLTNIKILRTGAFAYDIPTGGVDLVLLVTVLHEIEAKADLLREVVRILKPSGTLCVIEFKKEPTPFGPPLDHRIGIDAVVSVCADSGFTEKERFVLGENLYCVMFRPPNR